MRQGVNENKNSDNGIHLTPGILGPLVPKATAFGGSGLLIGFINCRPGGVYDLLERILVNYHLCFSLDILEQLFY